MPNWPISQRAQSYLRKRAMDLSERALAYAQDDFPLTTAQLQYSIMPEERVNTLRRLINEGVKTIEKHREVRVAFLRQKFPELRRGAVVKLVLPEWIVVDRSTHYGISSTKFSMDESHYLTPDLDREGAGEHPTNTQVSPESRAELVAWINRGIRQKRLHQVVAHTVDAIVPKHAPTCAHLHQIWPMLTTLMNNDEAALNPHYHGDKVFYEQWRERFRAPSRALKSYRPDPNVWDKYKKLIHASDMVLTAGTVLAPYTHNPKIIHAELTHWEPVEGDRTF